MKKILFVSLLLLSASMRTEDISVSGILQERRIDEFLVTATIYSVDTVQTTASGYVIDSLTHEKVNIIAISRDLRSHLSFGDKVLVSGVDAYDGIYIIADLMHKRWTDKIDILVSSEASLNKFYNVVMKRIEE